MHRILAIALVSACVPTSFTYSPSFAKGPPPRPEGCPVEVVTSPPDKRFEEVGMLAFYNGTEPATVDAFKQAVAKQVCQVGGDAVIATADAKGHYTSGTVIHYVK